MAERWKRVGIKSQSASINKNEINARHVGIKVRKIAAQQGARRPRIDLTNDFSVSGNVTNSINVASAGTQVLQTIAVTVPARKRMVLRRIRFKFQDIAFALSVQSGTRGFVSSVNEEDVFFGNKIVIFNNTSSKDTHVEINIGAVNMDSTDSHTLKIGDGWWTEIALV